MKEIKTESIIKELRERKNKNITLNKAIARLAKDLEVSSSCIYARLKKTDNKEYEELKQGYKITTRFKERYIYDREYHNYFNGDKIISNLKKMTAKSVASVPVAEITKLPVSELTVEGKYFSAKVQNGIIQLNKKSGKDIFLISEFEDMLTELTDALKAHSSIG